jgi:hypothetical protein
MTTPPVPARRPAPDVAIATGVFHPAPGVPAMPHLLIARPGPGRSDDIARLADALGLRTSLTWARDIGPRITVRRDQAVLDHGDDHHLLEIPAPGPRWLDLAYARAVCRITAALDPIPHRTQELVDRAVHRQHTHGRLRWGTARIRIYP